MVFLPISRKNDIFVTVLDMDIEDGAALLHFNEYCILSCIPSTRSHHISHTKYYSFLFESINKV